MASEMVERVVRAMDHAEHKVIRNSEGVDMRVARARAAIAAMREPTEAMEKAGARTWDDDLCTETNALNMWRAMVDEALR